MPVYTGEWFSLINSVLTAINSVPPPFVGAMTTATLIGNPHLLYVMSQIHGISVSPGLTAVLKG